MISSWNTLPACLSDTGDFPSPSQFPETNAADPETPQIRPRSSTDPTTIVSLGRKFRLTQGFNNQAFSGHNGLFL